MRFLKKIIDNNGGDINNFLKPEMTEKERIDIKTNMINKISEYFSLS